MTKSGSNTLVRNLRMCAEKIANHDEYEVFEIEVLAAADLIEHLLEVADVRRKKHLRLAKRLRDIRNVRRKIVAGIEWAVSCPDPKCRDGYLQEADDADVLCCMCCGAEYVLEDGY